MSYVYSAILQYQDSDGRFANLTQTPTVTAYDLAGNSIASPTITNIATGVYKVSVTQDDLEDVIFRVVPHADDQSDFDDVAVMQDKVTHTADDILTDTGTTLPAEIDAVDEDVWTYPDRQLTMSATNIISAVSEGNIVQVRGNTWDFEISGVKLDSHKQQFYIKRNDKFADSDALVGIDSVDGLLVLNGSSDVTPENASLTYNAAEEKLTVHVEAVETAQVPAGNMKYGIQDITATGVVSENYKGSFIIIPDIVRTTS